MLMPAYRPLIKVAKPVKKQIQVWPEGSSEALQDCFDTTDWDMFKQAATYNNTTDLQEYAETVSAYINKCINDVTVKKTITVRANQKPWMTEDVYRLLKTRNAAFRAGDEVGLRTARANLSPGIREAKRQYSRRIAHQFSNSRDTRSLWQGIQTITDYRPPPRTCDSKISLLNEVNTFFARFEKQNSSTAQKNPPPPGDQVLMLTPDSVRRSFSRINARKTPGPDNIPGRVLRDCAAELTNVFTDIFNISLRQAVVPTCFKATTIIPVQKKPSPSCFNDYRPVALTPIIMKCFERLVMHHIKSGAGAQQSAVQLAVGLSNWKTSGSNTSSTITLNTGAPQGCVLSPLLFTLLTHDCTPSHNSNLFIKFADDTTVVGLITNNDETNYRSQPAAIREETAEPTGQDQQVEGQLHPSGCQEAELAPELAPPSLFGLSTVLYRPRTITPLLPHM
ncbi:hypothetical protein Q8A73_003062 [Channa argus]|nr:hypothetical protein Q8A73_003062 [Channa argus]